MKKVVISVLGGVAYVENNKDDCTVVIVDWDNIEAGDIKPELTGNEDVIIEVSGGVAEPTKIKNNIDVEVIDYDNEE